MTRLRQLRDLGVMPVPTEQLVAYEALADRLAAPRRVAAEYVASTCPDAPSVVDVGSFQGELLEAFLDALPRASGQWTDAADSSLPIARRRLARFGDRVTYRIGCPGRDISDGTVPKGTEILATSWISSHRPAARLPEVYSAAAELLAAGGWLVHLEHVGFANRAVERRVLAAHAQLHVSWEGPPPHHDEPIATLDEHLGALRAAGLAQIDVPWRSLATCLLVARRPG